MATLISGNTALNMNNLGFVNFLSAVSFSANATTAQAIYSDGSFQLFSGSFVLDGSGHLIGGTINAITEIKAGDTPYVISGLSYPVTSFLAFLNAANGPGLIADMFSGADGISGGLGNDTLNGFAGLDTLAGGKGDDSISGGTGNDVLVGDDGNDSLDGGTGADTMNGGLGDDLYLVEGEGEVVAEFEEDGGIDTVHSTGSFTLGSGIENLMLKDGASSGSGNELDNVITGNDLRNFLYGGNGNDTILAGAGEDFINGNAGNDFIDGGDHYDNIEGGEGADCIFGGADNDFLLGNDGDDTIAGGSGSDTLGGQIGNDTLDGGAGADYLEGGKGDDAYYVDDTADVVREFAGEGTDTVLSTVNFTLGLQFENLTLLGSDNAIAIGNGVDNLLIGNAGNNLLDGASGNDTTAGGAGDDLYLVEGADVIIENAGEGFDTIWALNDFELPDNIEILVAIGPGVKGFGNALANEMYAFDAALYGLEGADTLIGDFGSDTLIGGAGDDSMAGGSGDDVYGVDSKFDLITELFWDGFDRVESSIDFELGENFEDLVLLGGATVGKGNSSYNQLWGNDGNNALFGNDNNDTIDGGAGNDTIDGGLGYDEMYGGLGDDLFFVDDESDFADDDPFDGGIDTVHSTAVSFTLGSGIENLVLKDAAWFGGGNELDNVIVGSEFDNSLDGADGSDSISGGAGNDELSGGFGADTLIGGAGADSMAGGADDDVYGVDSKSDVVTELSGDGRDTVQSFIDYELGANLEDLVLLDGATLGTGNSADNFILGNDGINGLFGGAGNDTLDGGAGMDLLVGGAGNDSYFVDQALDGVLESAGGGVDTVSSLVTYTLGGNIENLTLLGAAAVNGNGNGLANLMTGNDGANRLRGLGGGDTLDGGLGADTLTGGAGRDVFLRHGIGEGHDVVTDFTTGGSGDLLDIGDMLVGYVAGSSVIGDFVQTLQSGGNTILQIDADGGANGSIFTSVFTLSGVTTTVNDLVANGNLVLA